MSEIREDPISGRWVIIAPERSRRPLHFSNHSFPFPEDKKECPFCEGNEHQTPPEVFAVRREGSKRDGPGWKVRVFPNKFPALTPCKSVSIFHRGGFRWMEGAGVHEVVVETPSHDKQLSDLPLSQIKEVLSTFQERIKSIERESSCQYIQVFKNKGELAGASQTHTHSQIVATPLLSAKIKDKIERTEMYFQEHKKCLFCQIIREELHNKERLVTEEKYFCTITPFASKFSYEMHVYPFRHTPYFVEIDQQELKCLALILKNILSTLKQKFSNPPFIILLHQGPNPYFSGNKYFSLRNSFHWHMEIFPVLSSLAGFERGTGFYINPVPPEEAAQCLK